MENKVKDTPMAPLDPLDDGIIIPVTPVDNEAKEEA